MRKPSLRRLAALLIVPVTMLVLAGAAGAADTPMTAPGAKTVAAEEVQALIAKGAKVYDLRKKASYAEKHIPGALYGRFDEKSVKNVAYDPSADTFDLAQLPADKTVSVIFHGHGVDGWKGYKAAAAAAKAGYTHVYFFRGGFAEWVAKKLPIE